MILCYITFHSYVVMLHNELHNIVSWGNYSNQSQSIFYNASSNVVKSTCRSINYKCGFARILVIDARLLCENL